MTLDVHHSPPPQLVLAHYLESAPFAERLLKPQLANATFADPFCRLISRRLNFAKRLLTRSLCRCDFPKASLTATRNFVQRLG